MVTVYGLAAFMPELKGLVRDIRSVWTLEELGMPYERKVMNALEQEHKKPEFLALNPFGKVPVIQDGETVLFESSAICTYLGDKARKLLPAPGTTERYAYYQWLSFVTSTLEPVAVRVVGIDFFEEQRDASLVQYRNDALATATGMIAALDKELSSRPYLLGEAFSIVDIVLSSTMRLLGHTEVAAKFPAMQAYLNKNFERPAFVRALENNG